mgnify:CR=1
MKRFKTEYRRIPNEVQVIKGEHKGMVGLVWSFYEGICEIESHGGWYITEPLENLKILSTKRKLLLKIPIKRRGYQEASQQS